MVQEVIGAEGHPRGPPRIEFSYIRQLQQDNAELRSLLEEHQAALEIIMGKYRDQVGGWRELGWDVVRPPLLLPPHR